MCRILPSEGLRSLVLVLGPGRRQRIHHWNCVAPSREDVTAIRKVRSEVGAVVVRFGDERCEVFVMVA